MINIYDNKIQNKDIEAKIIIGLEKISEAFKALLWKHSKEYKLSPIQVQILVFIYNHDEKYARVSYLASEFNITKPTVSDAIKTLEEKGYIKRAYDTEDKRSIQFSLTKSGINIAKQLSSVENALLYPIKSLQDADKEVLLNSLVNVITQLQKSTIISMQRMCFSCRFYDNKNGKHYCKFLDKQLERTEIRIDCNEHEKKQ